MHCPCDFFIKIIIEDTHERSAVTISTVVYIKSTCTCIKTKQLLSQLANCITEIQGRVQISVNETSPCSHCSLYSTGDI